MEKTIRQIPQRHHFPEYMRSRNLLQSQYNQSGSDQQSIYTSIGTDTESVAEFSLETCRCIS